MIRSPVAGVSVFVPPPPPSTGSSDANANFGQSAFASLPLTDSVVDDGTPQEEFLGIRIPPLRVSGITSRKKESGGRGAAGDLTTDEDENKVHNTPFAVLLSVLKLVKVERGRQKIQWKVVAIYVLIFCFLLFLLHKLSYAISGADKQLQLDAQNQFDGTATTDAE